MRTKRRICGSSSTSRAVGAGSFMSWFIQFVSSGMAGGVPQRQRECEAAPPAERRARDAAAVRSTMARQIASPRPTPAWPTRARRA
jgi:hypothetical protein